ncbi:MAG: hypothetical protein KGL39_20315 [Patescibacteria group bacterium]|nr:hypothetical protein [Patescibacteria group bacterium]
MKLVARILLFAAAAFGANYNGIYLGGDVGSLNGAQDWAVRITQDGTVYAHIGAAVPGLHDAQGRQVYVTRIKRVSR